MVLLPQDRIVADMYEAAERSRRAETRNYLGMSGIGDRCARKLWYQFRGYSPRLLEGRSIMIFDLGNRVEDAVVTWLRRAGYRVEGQQDVFEAHKGLFRGHCDGRLYGVTSRPHILEIKSANDNKFKAFKAGGVRAVAPVYFCQVQCYMGYAGLERALFVIMNKNTCELYTERVYFSQEDFEALHQRAYAIISSRKPPKEGCPPDSLDCAWCDFRNHCRAPDLAVQTRRTCGTCHWLDVDGTAMRCGHQTHPMPLKRWGETCDDWLFTENVDGVPF